MSFDPAIRSTSNFQESFGKLKRRVTRSEVPLDDIENLQAKVNNMRTQIDFAQVYDNVDNVHEIVAGPFDFIFEPDNSEIKMYNKFKRHYGNGRKLDKTLNSVDYDVIQIGDSSNFAASLNNTRYHHEPYGTFSGSSTLVSEPTAPDLAPPFSISLWFRTSYNYFNDGPSDFGYMVYKGSFASGTLNFAMIISSDLDPPNHAAEIIFSIGAGTTWASAAGSGLGNGPFVNVIDGNWHMLTGTYAGNNLKIYLDAFLDHTEDTGGATPPTNNVDMTIGGGTTSQFIGDLDEIRMWDVELTQAQITALYESGTVPATGDVVYENTFGTGTSKRCYYAAVDGTTGWDWIINNHPNTQINSDAILLNENQFLYYDEFGTDFDFTANNASFGFWIYPTSLPSSRATNDLVMARRIDANNSLRIEIDDADNKLFGEYRVGGSSSIRQYDTPLVANTWYYINGTCSFSGPTLSLKVNDNADTSSVKAIGSAPNDDKLYFGGFGNSSRHFYGYLAFPHWYKHSTVLTTAERTALYTYGTKSDTTKPMIFGLSKFG